MSTISTAALQLPKNTGYYRCRDKCNVEFEAAEDALYQNLVVQSQNTVSQFMLDSNPAKMLHHQSDLKGSLVKEHTKGLHAEAM